MYFRSTRLLGSKSRPIGIFICFSTSKIIIYVQESGAWITSCSWNVISNRTEAIWNHNTIRDLYCRLWPWQCFAELSTIAIRPPTGARGKDRERSATWGLLGVSGRIWSAGVKCIISGRHSLSLPRYIGSGAGCDTGWLDDNSPYLIWLLSGKMLKKLRVEN